MSDAIPAAAKAEPVTPDPAPKPKVHTNSPKGATGTNERRAKPAAPAGEAKSSPQGQPATTPATPAPGSLSESAARSIDRLWGFTD